MSKERGLLERIAGKDMFSYYYNDIVMEIKELLAQPDALAKLIEVRDIQGREGNFDQDEYMRGLYNGLELAVSIFEGDREPLYRNHIEDKLAMVEPVAWMYDWNIPVEKNQEAQHVFRSKNHLTTDLTHVLNDVENIRPLYLAPSSREGLTPREGLTEYKKGYARAELDLKRKCLSIKQAEDLWETTFKSAVPYYIFDEICVAIERYHEIGAEQ